MEQIINKLSTVNNKIKIHCDNFNDISNEKYFEELIILLEEHIKLTSSEKILKLKLELLDILFIKGMYLKNYKFRPFKFSVIGDYGDSYQMKGLVENIKEQNVNFIVTVGDNNYPHGSSNTINKNISKYLGDYIGNYKGGNYKDSELYTGKGSGSGFRDNRLFPCMGNHDWVAYNRGIENFLAYDDYFTLPGKGFASSSNSNIYYDFIYGSIHFFMLQSHPTIKPFNDKYNGCKFAILGKKEIQTIQNKWFMEQVKKSTSKWKVVVFHHNPIGRGATQYMNIDYKSLGIDIVLYGHRHMYTRKIINDVYYINCGCGSTLMNGDTKYNWDFMYDRQTKCENTYINGQNCTAHVLFEVNENNMEVKLITGADEIIEQFTINKQ